MIVFLSHFRHIYLAARRRSIKRLTPRERLVKGFSTLTEKQIEVAVWLAEGKSNAIIAKLLGISIAGVKFHLRAIFQKLGVEDRLGAALLAREHQPERMFSKATTLVLPHEPVKTGHMSANKSEALKRILKGDFSGVPNECIARLIKAINESTDAPQ